MSEFIIKQVTKSYKALDDVYLYENKKFKKTKTIYKKINFDIILEKIKSILLVLIDYVELHENVENKDYLKRNLKVIILQIEDFFHSGNGISYYQKDIVDNIIDDIVNNLKDIENS